MADPLNQNMADSKLLWNKTPGYLAMTSITMQPGGRATYVVPRPMGTSSYDTTSFHPGQANWSKENMTYLMYELYPSQAWKDFSRSGLPPVKRDINGAPMFERWPDANRKPRYLLAFDVLPDKIGTLESALLIEEWRRWDPRIRWQDILMRMTQPRPVQNILNMRGSRMRADYCLLSWHVKTKHDEDNAARDAVLYRLSLQQKIANTTRGTTPGLIYPVLGVVGGIIPHPHERSGKRTPTNKQAANKKSTISGHSKDSKKASIFTKSYKKTMKSVAKPKNSGVQTRRMSRDTTIGNSALNLSKPNPVARHPTGYTVQNIDGTSPETDQAGVPVQHNIVSDDSDSGLSSPPPESDSDATISLHSYKHRPEKQITRQDTYESKELSKKMNDVAKFEPSSDNKLFETPKWTILQMARTAMNRENGNLGNGQERTAYPFTDPQNPVLRYVLRQKTYNHEPHNSQSVSQGLFTQATQFPSHNSVEQVDTQDGTNHGTQDEASALGYSFRGRGNGIEDQAPTLGYIVPGHGVETHEIRSGPWSTNQDTLAENDPTTAWLDSPANLTSVTAEHWRTYQVATTAAESVMAWRGSPATLTSAIAEQWRTYQNITAGAEPTMAWPNSPATLRFDTAQVFDPTEAVDEMFWEGYCASAQDSTDQGFQNANAVNEGSWLEPEYKRARWSDFTTD